MITDTPVDQAGEIVIDLTDLIPDQIYTMITQLPAHIHSVGFYTSSLDDSDKEIWEVPAVRMMFITAYAATLLKFDKPPTLGEQAALTCMAAHMGIGIKKVMAQ